MVKKNADIVLIIINWLGREGLQFILREQEACKMVNGLCGTLTDKFTPQLNEKILSLQYYKLIRNNETAEDWMDMLRVMSADCKYKEIDSHLRQQNIYGLNDDSNVTEIIGELTAVNDMSSVTRGQDLASAKLVETKKEL